MTLIEDAGRIWHRLWTIRLAGLASALGVTSAALQSLGDAAGVPPRVAFACTVGSVVCTVLVPIARLVAQPKARTRAARAKSAARHRRHG